MLSLPEEDGYYVYILRCNNDSLYTGWTTNLKKRYDAHIQGKGARYTKAHPPIACVYYESLMDKCSAMKREYEIKQRTKQQKELMIKELQQEEE